MKAAAQILIKNGIRPSLQRLLVYRFLRDNPVHPTVDTIYTALAPDIPTLSKTTVYNTLKLFEQTNIVQTIFTDSEKIRYDANMEDHLHFCCSKCGTVYDIISATANKIKADALQTLPSGFAAEKTHLYIWGICNKCRSH